MSKALKGKFVHGAHDLFFKTVHHRWLIYNASWEDPRIDRQLLELNENSKVVVLTSAGCNVLDYLIDGPAEINAIDVNPRQNALLNLKLALIKRGNHDDLFAMFGQGAHSDFRQVYADVKQYLAEEDRKFWDKKIVYFDLNSKKKSFYYYGSSGLLAWMITRYLSRNHQLKTELFSLFDADNLHDQKEIYERIEPLIWGRFISWLVRQPYALTLAGVPRPQIALINTQYPGGVGGYISDKLRHVFTEILANDNYFWHVYLTGSYSKKCCPNYLKLENFETIQKQVDRVKIHNNSVTGFLRQNPGKYSHFVLLDHQDWLAQHDPAGLEEEWQLILENSQPGSKVLMRSAAMEINFLPGFVKQALQFFPEQTNLLHTTDRVGTYGSLHFAEVL
jgi:S-adenosylmethionine-diacylglycerol 3-amino-3-carboxypropyl transferase